MKISTFGLTFLVALTACGSAVQESNNLPDRVGQNAETTGVTSDRLRDTALGQALQDTATLNGNWFLVPALASDTAAGKVPTISFDLSAKTFTGNTGCNSMRGSFENTTGALQINEQIITTKMACPGYNEEAFLKNLSGTNGHKFDNGMLILLNNGAESSRWTRTKVKPNIIKSM